MIHGFGASSPSGDEAEPLVAESLFKVNLLSNENDPPQIIVHVEDDLAIIGVNCKDRSGVLQDISECITRLSLQCRRTEAIAFCFRSISVWRCELLNKGGVDAEEIWDAVKVSICDVQLLLVFTDRFIFAKKKTDVKCKQRPLSLCTPFFIFKDLLTTEGESEVSNSSRWIGASIIRAAVTQESRLVGKTASDVNFNVKYKADILAIQRKGKNVTAHLSRTPFEVGDVLILTAFRESCLLKQNSPAYSTRRSSSTSDLLKSEVSPLNKLRHFLSHANAVHGASKASVGSLHDQFRVSTMVEEVR